MVTRDNRDNEVLQVQLAPQETLDQLDPLDHRARQEPKDFPVSREAQDSLVLLDPLDLLDLEGLVEVGEQLEQLDLMAP